MPTIHSPVDVWATSTWTGSSCGLGRVSSEEVSLSGGNNVTLPDGVELHRVLLGLTDHLRDHRQVRHLHGGPAELEDDDEEGVVGEPGRHTTVRRAQEAVDQQQRERYRHCYRTWNVMGKRIIKQIHHASIRDFSSEPHSVRFANFVLNAFSRT